MPINPHLFREAFDPRGARAPKNREGKKKIRGEERERKRKKPF